MDCRRPGSKTVFCPKDGVWMSDVSNVNSEMVPPGGLEPPTVRLEVGYSIQLNYEGAGAEAYPLGRRQCQDEVTTR